MTAFATSEHQAACPDAPAGIAAAGAPASAVSAAPLRLLGDDLLLLIGP